MQVMYVPATLTNAVSLMEAESSINLFSRLSILTMAADKVLNFLRPCFGGGCQPLPGGWGVVFSNLLQPWSGSSTWQCQHFRTGKVLLMIITHLSFIDCHNWPSSEGRKPIVQQNIPHLYHNIWITSIRQTWILKKDGTSSLATNSTLQIRSLGARVFITSLNSPGDNCEEKAKIKISLLKYFSCLVWSQGVDLVQLTVAHQLLGYGCQGGYHQHCWTYCWARLET